MRAVCLAYAVDIEECGWTGGSIRVAKIGFGSELGGFDEIFANFELAVAERRLMALIDGRLEQGSFEKVARDGLALMGVHLGDDFFERRRLAN